MTLLTHLTHHTYLATILTFLVDPLLTTPFHFTYCQNTYPILIIHFILHHCSLQPHLINSLLHPSPHRTYTPPTLITSHPTSPTFAIPNFTRCHYILHFICFHHTHTPPTVMATPPYLTHSGKPLPQLLSPYPPHYL